LPIDALKIDRSFVNDVQHDERNAFICRAMIALGHGLGLQVVAEGVEDNAQYDWLQRHGCDRAQGFGLGRPMPLAEALGMLGRRDARASS
jgi:EAL domain-containing protein (putative c-di-GMP-specific phosphodiesterase class I)